MKKLVLLRQGGGGVDLFDADRLNQWGELYCVAPAILSSQVKEAWKRYLKTPTERREGITDLVGWCVGAKVGGGSR